MRPKAIVMDIVEFDISESTNLKIGFYISSRNGSLSVDYEIKKDGDSVIFKRISS